MLKIAPTPWGRDKYGSVIDATGERVELTGIAMATGRISDDALCHGNSALLLAAPRLLKALQLYQAAGFGNSTDFAKQDAAHAAAVEVLFALGAV
jgi:hypothetical protein